MVDERKLRFDVEVTEGERTIGVGTHERRVIAWARSSRADRGAMRLNVRASFAASPAA